MKRFAATVASWIHEATAWLVILSVTVLVGVFSLFGIALYSIIIGLVIQGAITIVPSVHP